MADLGLNYLTDKKVVPICKKQISKVSLTIIKPKKMQITDFKQNFSYKRQ